MGVEHSYPLATAAGRYKTVMTFNISENDIISMRITEKGRWHYARRLAQEILRQAWLQLDPISRPAAMLDHANLYLLNRRRYASLRPLPLQHFDEETWPEDHEDL
jgi:hypothetical protein